MTKNNNVIIRILFICLGIVLMVYFTFNQKKQKRYQWSETYRVNSDQPYGTLFIQKLLESYRPGKNFILNKTKPLHRLMDSVSTATKTDYVFIGQDIFLDDADKDALLHFIYSGNDAFIATINLPFDLIDAVFISDCDRNIFLQEKDTLAVTMNFYNRSITTEKGYTYSYRIHEKDIAYYWNTLNPEIFCDSTESVTPLGYIYPDKVNFFRFSYGKGNLYVHTNPLVFTNFFMINPDKVTYASGVFSHLEGESIIWDEFSKSEFAFNNASEMSPVSYILQQESLRYAWWLMLTGAILYTLFTAKRKQRVIPVLEEKTNTSFEFINMVSSLHYKNGDHRGIGKKKMKYFYYFIRVRYGIHTHSLTEEYIKRLSDRSKVKSADLESVAHQFGHIESPSYYDESKLTTLYHSLENFYKHCK